MRAPPACGQSLASIEGAHMAMLFYVVGWIVTAVGAGYAFLVAGTSTPQSASGMYLLAKGFAMLPGFGLIGTGLIFVAIGAVLTRLDVMISYQKWTARD